MNRYDGIDKEIVSNVKVYAKHLKRHMAFSSMDVEDLEQELMCKILSCIGKFDKQYGDLEHFIRKVLKRHGLNLLAKYTRKKRSPIIKLSKYYDEMQNDNANDDFRRNLTAFEKHMEVAQFINAMPFKYRLIYKFLESNYSFSQIAQIMKISNSSMTRNLQRIVHLFQRFENSKDRFCFLANQEGKNMSKNLSVIETMGVKELSRLEVYDLADLHEQLSKLINHAKELKEKFEDALELRFSETIKNNLRSENRDTGTTKFFENGFQITAEVPKKVTWDSEKISEIIKTISEEKCKAIIKTTHVIDERKYTQLSPEDKALFIEARIVTPGKTKFKISIPEEEI